MASLGIQHVDTCLSCYVLDHCNGDNEQLFGVAVDRNSRIWEVKAQLIAEIQVMGDKLPETITESDIYAAVKELFNGVHPLKVFEHMDYSFSDDDHGEYAYAWFRASWEGVR